MLDIWKFIFAYKKLIGELHVKMKYIIKWIADVCRQCTFIFKTINTICMLYDDLKVFSQMDLKQCNGT